MYRGRDDVSNVQTVWDHFGEVKPLEPVMLNVILVVTDDPLETERVFVVDIGLLPWEDFVGFVRLGHCSF